VFHKFVSRVHKFNYERKHGKVANDEIWGGTEIESVKVQRVKAFEMIANVVLLQDQKAPNPLCKSISRSSELKQGDLHQRRNPESIIVLHLCIRGVIYEVSRSHGGRSPRNLAPSVIYIATMQLYS